MVWLPQRALEMYKVVVMKWWLDVCKSMNDVASGRKMARTVKYVNKEVWTEERNLYSGDKERIGVV